MRRILTIVLAVACGAPSTPLNQPAAPNAPQLLGRPVALEPLQEPMAQTAYAYAKQALADTPPVSPDLDQHFAWLDKRTQAIMRLEETVDKLPNLDEKVPLLFGLILNAVVIDDLIGDIAELPEVSDASYHERLEKLVAAMAKRAARYYDLCSELVGSGPPALQVWSEHCRTRSDALAFLGVRISSAKQRSLTR